MKFIVHSPNLVPTEFLILHLVDAVTSIQSKPLVYSNSFAFWKEANS